MRSLLREKTQRLLAVSALVAAACGDDSSTDTTTVVTTAIIVDPAEFLGDLPCADIDGAPRSYRATVYDIEDNTVIGVSEPTSCGAKIAFSNVETAHFYAADIEVFDAPAEDSPTSAAWTTTCGKNGGAGRAQVQEQVTIRGCEPISAPGTATTAITVDLGSTLGQLACTADGGDVAELTVTPTAPDGTALPAITDACGKPPVKYGASIEPGEHYAFRVDARDASNAVRWATTCSVTAGAGLVMPADCGLLSDRGSLQIPLFDALATADLTCGDTATHALVALAAGPETSDPLPVDCAVDPRFDGVAAGSYVATLEIFDGDASVALFTCTGTAAPAATTELVCTRED